MIAIVGILFLVVVLAALFLLRVARTWVLAEGATEARLRDPETHTLSYLVPNGQDPAALMSALAHAEFTTVTDAHGGIERLLIACEEADRSRVREILEAASLTRLAGHVSFEDEPVLHRTPAPAPSTAHPKARQAVAGRPAETGPTSHTMRPSASRRRGL
jgi:hypothetical protein